MHFWCTFGFSQNLLTSRKLGKLRKFFPFSKFTKLVNGDSGNQQVMEMMDWTASLSETPGMTMTWRSPTATLWTKVENLRTTCPQIMGHFTSIGQWELRGLRGVGLDQASYDEYRWEQLFNAHGVEHYVVKQLAWLRRLPVNEAMWNEIRDLMSLQKSIQLGGPEVRTFEHELWPTCWGDDATFSGAAWGVWTLMKSRRRAYSLTSWPRWDMDGVTQQMNQEKKIRGATHQKKWKSKSKWRWSQRWSQPHLWLRSFQMWWPGHRLTDRWEPEARLAEKAELVRSQRARQ